jgi:hypothetical protein
MDKVVMLHPHNRTLGDMVFYQTLPDNSSLLDMKHRKLKTLLIPPLNYICQKHTL